MQTPVQLHRKADKDTGAVNPFPEIQVDVVLPVA
jgi:hypothetical protein